ncbi:SDR family NAD(P)-dependent oxidoreductase [Amycolatopsis thailandensis]|uniref:SDR family NAD(P)-dependent oxidoreductase n=1 Tax=Amycolatopsis thailandensis TaxID=589330 RepID=UPI001FC95B12|nr:SDR family NAD(P)-dependent oxidoreductase [Amycolatopsis thailandensis]
MLFLITDVGSGLGRAFAQGALDAGHVVVERRLDVTDDDAVFSVVEEIEAQVGSIDVLIANAGYGQEGVFEESPLSELRAQFAINVFGVAATVQAVLPFMRERRAGHVFAVSPAHRPRRPGTTKRHVAKLGRQVSRKSTGGRESTYVYRTLTSCPVLAARHGLPRLASVVRRDFSHGLPT